MKRNWLHQLHRSESGIETIEWIAMLAVLALTIAGVGFILTPGGSQVGHTVTSGILCWASEIGGGGGGACSSGGGGGPTVGVGQPGGGGNLGGSGQPGGNGQPGSPSNPGGNGQPGNGNAPGGNGGHSSGDNGGNWWDKIPGWIKGRISDIAQFFTKDLPEILGKLPKTIEGWLIQIRDFGDGITVDIQHIIATITQMSTWQDVLKSILFGEGESLLERLVKGLGRNILFAGLIALGFNILDKILSGHPGDILSWDFVRSVLGDTVVNLLVGALAVAAVAGGLALLGVTAPAWIVGGLIVLVGIGIGILFDATGLTDTIKGWISQLLGGKPHAETAPATP